MHTALPRTPLHCDTHTLSLMQHYAATSLTTGWALTHDCSTQETLLCCSHSATALLHYTSTPLGALSQPPNTRGGENKVATHH